MYFQKLLSLALNLAFEILNSIIGYIIICFYSNNPPETA